MKRLSIAIVFLSVALTLTGPVAAQSPQPPIDRPNQPSAQGPAPMRGEALQSTGAVRSPSVDLGQPEIAFSYVKSFGESAMPYLADSQHLLNPNGLFIDASNSLYVAEENGYRVLKYNAAGANTLTLGEAGQPWHHDRFLYHPKHTAVDAHGNIWVSFDIGLLTNGMDKQE